MNTKVHFSSVKMDYPTPKKFFNLLNEEFNFTLDAAADSSNAKCDKYYDEQANGLTKDWKNESVFINPPYGRAIGDWVKKAYEASLAGATCVLLIPSRTDTRWFQDYCLPYGEIRFIKGRLKFEGAVNVAPFPSCVVIFRGKND